MKRPSMFLMAIPFLLMECISCDPTPSTDCQTPATVVDLTGLDGCGFVFELEDGTRLEPVIRVYIQPAPEDPLYNFQWADGKKVFIDYQEDPDLVSVCMAGKMINVTCLTERPSTAD